MLSLSKNFRHRSGRSFVLQSQHLGLAISGFPRLVAVKVVVAGSAVDVFAAAVTGAAAEHLAHDHPAERVKVRSAVTHLQASSQS